MVEVVHGDITQIGNTHVLMNGFSFRATKMVILNMKTEPLEHTTEEGFKIIDHLREEPINIKLSMKAYDWWRNERQIYETRQFQIERLQAWKENKVIISLETDLGIFDNMIITVLKAAESSSSGSSYDLDIEMQQLYIAYLLPIEEQWYYDVDGEAYDQETYESTNVDGTLSEPRPKVVKNTHWNLGHNTGEIWDWATTLGKNEIEWKWPWE